MGVISYDDYQRLSADVAKGGSAAQAALSQLSGNTVAPRPSTPSSSGSNPFGGSSYGVKYTPPSSVSAPAPRTAPTSYSGPANVIGNISGAESFGKGIQNVSSGYLASNPQYNAHGLSTYTDNAGSVYNTSDMTPQQIFALSLSKENNPKAAAILAGMGLDLNGNPTSTYKPTYSNSNSSSSPQPQVSSSTYSPTPERNYTVPNSMASYTGGDGKTLAQYAQDTQAAQTEIMRAKQVYDQKVKAGDMAGAQAAHAWADQVRQAAGISNYDATYGGDNAPSGSGASNGVPSGTGAGTGTGTGTGTPTAGAGAGASTNPQDAMAEYWKKLQDAIDAMNNTNNQKWQQDLALAKQQAAQIFKQKTDSYNNLVNSLKSGQQNELSNLQNSLEADKGNIEDRTFQDWLSARQNAASRGLGSSGLASDADTRLLLARQKNLAGLYNTNLKNVNDINQRYGSQLATANSNLSNLSQSDLERQAFADLYKTGSQGLSDQAKIFADLLSKSMGYSYAKPADLLQHDIDLKKIGFDYDKLDAESKQFYDKLDSDNAYRVAKLSADYNTNMTKIMGYDSKTGELTLDSKQLLETMRHNKATENITAAHNSAEEAIGRMNAANGAENARLRGEELTETINNHVAQTQLEADKLKNTNLNQQAQDLLSTARAAQSKMNATVKQKADYMDTFKNDTSKLQTDAVKAELDKYDRAIKIAADDIDAATNSVMVMRKLKDPNAMPINGGLTNNSGGR